MPTRYAKSEIQPHHHGTLNGYTYYRCRCGDCRAALAEWSNRRYYERKANLRILRGRAVQPYPTPDGPIEHGKYSTYWGWSCRCDPCTDAASEAFQRYYRTGRYA